MARHSKNNTAGSVFTYSEREKLKKEGEWGQSSQRISGESQKLFEQCSLCMKSITAPVACPKGHLFCFECIMENLISQKKELSNKKLKDHYSKGKALENFEQEKIKELQNKTNNLIEATDYLVVKSQDEVVFEDDINHKSQSKPEDFNVDSRKTKIINCFWVPENTPKAITDTDKHEKEKHFLTKCPVGNHNLKVKDLLNCKIDMLSGKAYCKNCKSMIGYQQVLLFPNCGCTLCKRCYDRIYVDAIEEKKSCSYCNVISSNIIKLKESASGFANCKEVVKKQYAPSFIS